MEKKWILMNFKVTFDPISVCKLTWFTIGLFRDINSVKSVLNIAIHQKQHAFLYEEKKEILQNNLELQETFRDNFERIDCTAIISLI